MSRQLTLPLGGSTRTDAPPRLGWPVATEGGTPFDDDERFFEPWWPGAQAVLRLEDGRLELRTEHLSDPLVAFPELRGIGAHLRTDRALVEGTLLALDREGRPDPRLLRQHLTGAGRDEAEGAFVAADLPWVGGEDLSRRPYRERRSRLADILEDSPHAVLGRGLVGEGRMLAHAVAAMGLPAISARRLDARWRAGAAGDAWLRLPVDEPPAPETRPFLVLLARLPLDA